jgi:hypothetical protein
VSAAPTSPTNFTTLFQKCYPVHIFIVSQHTKYICRNVHTTETLASDLMPSHRTSPNRPHSQHMHAHAHAQHTHTHTPRTRTRTRTRTHAHSLPRHLADTELVQTQSRLDAAGDGRAQSSSSEAARQLAYRYKAHRDANLESGTTRCYRPLTTQ